MGINNSCFIETHSEIDKYKVFIENIHPKTSEECLCNFVESRGNAIPVDIIYGDVPGTALVMFSEEPGKSVKSNNTPGTIT